jgi:Family of unknown function (DUF6130)
MTMLIKAFAAIAAGSVLATGAIAEGAKEVGPSQLVGVANEPAPRLFVDPPLPGPLARGVALISYRAENFRILPVLGAAGAEVSPRVGHLHVRVDDLPWYWGDFGNSNTIVVTDLPPGEHKVRIELASPEHHVHAGQTVTFIVPGRAK